MNGRDNPWGAARVSVSLLVAAMAVLSGQSARAEEQSSGSPESPESAGLNVDAPSVLSVTRLPYARNEVPASVTILDRELIESSGARTIIELLRMVPGMLVGYENGHRHMASYHGLADEFSRRMQVLVDGRAVYLPSFGGVSWTDLPLHIEDIERIEVIRGPGGSSYSANGLLGAIHIYSRPPVKGASGRVHAGTNGIRDGLVRVGDRENGSAWSLALGQRCDEGLEGRDDSACTDTLNLNGEYRISPDLVAELDVGYADGSRERGHPNSLSSPTRNAAVLFRHIQFRLSQALASGGSLKTSLYGLHQESDERFNLGVTVPPFGILSIPVNNDVEAQRYDLDIEHVLPAHGGLRLAWGGGARRERVVWPGYLGAPDPMENSVYRLFSSGEWRFRPEWLLNAGGAVESSGISGTEFLPRLGLIWHVHPDHTVRLGASRAARSPMLIEEKADAPLCLNASCTLFEQYAHSSGGLDAERVTAYELGWLAGFAGHASVEVRVFEEQVERIVALVTKPFPDSVPGTPTLDFSNLEEAVIHGIEFTVDARPHPRLRGLFSYANVDIGASDITSRFSNSMPRNSGSLVLIWRPVQNWQTRLGYYYYDRYAWIGAPELPASGRVDARVAWQFRGSRMDGRVSLTGQNLRDDYPEYNLKQSLRRAIYLGLEMDIF